MTNPTAPSARLQYPNLSTVNEQYINDKILANNKFNNNINIIKDIRNYYETETNNYNKKLSRYKNHIKVAEITEILFLSIATTATTTSVALTGIGLTYSIPTSFATATVCCPLSKTINTKIRNKIIKYTQMYILSKQFSDKFNILYTKSMNDNKIDNDEYNELVKVYEEYKKNRRSHNSVDKKNKLSVVFRLKLLVLSNNNVFSNSNISINIYPRSGYTDQGTCFADRASPMFHYR